MVNVMLIEFSVENFRSIRDEARFSLVASHGGEHRDTHLVTPDMTGGVRVNPLVRSAAIYGANAAGKTNLVQALATMRRIVTDSSADLDELPVTPFRFDPDCEGEPTTFEVSCIADGVRYQYGFKATHEHISDEWLFAWPRGRVQIWFERSSDTWKFGDKLTGDKEVWRRATRSNALYLSTAVALNSRQLRPIYDWFKKELHISSPRGWNNTFSMSCCRDERKSDIIDFLNVADLAIADVRVVDEDFQPEKLPQDIDSDLKSQIMEKFAGKKILELHLTHDVGNGSPTELELQDESDGTRRLFALSGPWLDTLKKGHVIVFDELHASLHPALVRFLVDQFHDPKRNVKGGQLVFTTHDTSILNQDIFRRDQVWFCERNEQQESRLFPLADFSPRKGIENLERSYLAGRYGALPYISNQF